MGWFTKSSSKGPDTSKGLFVVCPGCKAHVFEEERRNNLKVCPKCNHHDRLTYKERLDLIVDPGTFR